MTTLKVLIRVYSLPDLLLPRVSPNNNLVTRPPTLAPFHLKHGEANTTPYNPTALGSTTPTIKETSRVNTPRPTISEMPSPPKQSFI